MIFRGSRSAFVLKSGPGSTYYECGSDTLPQIIELLPVPVRYRYNAVEQQHCGRSEQLPERKQYPPQHVLHTPYEECRSSLLPKEINA
jgi:hypothetical protein